MYYRGRKNRRRFIIFVCTILLFTGLVYGYISSDKPHRRPNIAKNTQENDKKNKNQNNQALDNEKPEEKDVANTSNEDKELVDFKENQEREIVTENTEIVFNTYYKTTGEIEKNAVKVPVTAVGMNLSQFKDYIEDNYSGWRIKTISTKTAALFREEEGFTPNTFLIQSKDGYIVIYKINEFGEKELYEETNISTSVLTEIDKRKLKKGILVDNLNAAYRIVEDYSS
jgi:hypothetical protein